MQKGKIDQIKPITENMCTMHILRNVVYEKRSYYYVEVYDENGYKLNRETKEQKVSTKHKGCDFEGKIGIMKRFKGQKKS